MNKLFADPNVTMRIDASYLARVVSMSRKLVLYLYVICLLMGLSELDNALTHALLVMISKQGTNSGYNVEPDELDEQLFFFN